MPHLFHIDPLSNQFEQLKLVGRISLWFACVALAGLLALFFTPSTPTDDYTVAFRTLQMTRDNLPWVMAIGGLLLLLGTGVTIWLITLYSSFRVAGPLYRIARNMETGRGFGEVPPVRLRARDQLQGESALVGATQQALNQYYRELELAADAALLQLEAEGEPDWDELARALDRLKQLQSRVRIDDAC